MKREVCTEISRFLGLRTRPIAVKMLRSEEEIPAYAVRPLKDMGHRMALCQAFSRARRQGITTALLLEDNWCPEPLIGFGYGEAPEFFLNGGNRYPASASTPEAGARWAQNMPRLQAGQYIGILCGPWESTDFEPDTVIMYCDPAQLTQLMISVNWIDGGDAFSQISGHAACVYAAVPAILSRQFTVAVPCIGDRKRGIAQDNEMIFTCPPEKAEALMEGFRKCTSTQVGFPIQQDVAFEYPLAPAYKKIGEMMGLHYD